MGIESATTIAGLNAAWPLGTDPKSEGDNHLRLIKSVLKADAASVSVRNSFETSQEIVAAAPYMLFHETDVAANLGWWSVGLASGVLDLSPRDSTGALLGGSGGLRLSRDAFGMNLARFTLASGGTMTFGEFGGSLEVVRTGYGSTRLNSSTTGVLVGGPDQGSLGNFYAALNASGTTVFRVLAPSGNVQNVNNSYGAISDLRLKSNIAEAGPQLGDVQALRVVHFTLTEDPAQVKQIGLIAQEVQAVKPGLVEEDPDTGMLGVKYSVLVPILLKAVQELAARVEALEAAA